ncbi:GNAT family N-acetyltransferase [Dysgonomonas sp. GY75]|uniref:GNAT family N-acetyltransferase n=1 Tax=Dysgonomonas sp. GY75 TaxID=2780419 RepID=UPI0018842089|nr:GNAT family N-acetyltransferase [Dysgonomonas sp. GY75]MBF0648590.1 GNAT family N-acetyltransferase [Dysgonomonas sp. GY75]
MDIFEIEIKRTNSGNEDFRKLVVELEKHLTFADEKAHSECKQYNKLETIKYVVVAYIEGKAIGCGAIRKYDSDTIEVKRMFVSIDARGQGVGTKMLLELEAWAIELGFKKSILETGNMLPEAVRLYKKSNYIQIPNYGQYEGMEKSICFAKKL